MTTQINQNQALVLLLSAEGSKFQGLTYGVYKNILKPLAKKLEAIAGPVPAVGMMSFMREPIELTTLELSTDEVSMLKALWSSLELGMLPRGGTMDALFESIEEVVKGLTD